MHTCQKIKNPQKNKNKVLNTELLRNHKLLITQIKRHIYWDVRMGPAAGIEGQAEPDSKRRLWIRTRRRRAMALRVLRIRTVDSGLVGCRFVGAGTACRTNGSLGSSRWDWVYCVSVFFPMILRALLSLSPFEQKLLTKPKRFPTWTRSRWGGFSLF